MSWLEEKYLNLASGSFRNFRQKRSNPSLYEFSCPLCGDSASDEFKARGYIYEDEDDLKYKCHNCGVSMGFGHFLKQVDPNTFRTYAVEKFSKKKVSTPQFNVGKGGIKKFGKKQKAKKEITHEVFSVLEDLPQKAISYLEGRKIPDTSKFRYISDMRKLSPFIDDEINLFSEERIVVPVSNEKGQIVGVSCRTINPNNKLRYLNLKFSEEPLIFNISNVKKNTKVFVFEGVMDSLFVQNSVAVCGSDLEKVAQYITKDNLVLVYDNQPRNREILKKMRHSIDSGFSVVIWPKDFDKNGKDINKMIENGIGIERLNSIIQDNTYSGLKALAKFGNWKRI